MTTSTSPASRPDSPSRPDPPSRSDSSVETHCGWRVDGRGERLVRRLRLSDAEAADAFLDLLAQLSRLAGMPFTVGIAGGRVEGRLVAGEQGGRILDLNLEVHLARGEEALATPPESPP